jgi:hypothetical protein
MPFEDDTANEAYEKCVKPVCEEHQLNIRRADEFLAPNVVYDDIVNEIDRATMIIVDISGKNANVFYELGISHTLKRDRTIMLTHDDLKELPFDIAHFRVIHYEDSIASSSELKEKLQKTLGVLLEDLLATYKNDFEITIKAFKALNQVSRVFPLVGLLDPRVEIKPGGRLFVAGEYEGSRSESHSLYPGHDLEGLIELGYVKAIGDNLQLTELGKAFAEYCQQRGAICHQINQIKLTPGYKTLEETMKGSEKPGPPPPPESAQGAGVEPESARGSVGTEGSA